MGYHARDVVDIVSPTRTIADNIRDARLRLGLQQNELADRVGTSPANLNKWEKGTQEPNLESLFRLAMALELSIEALCEGINPAYDAARQRVPVPARLVEMWQRIADPADRRHAWYFLTRLARARSDLDDVDPPAIA